MDFQINHQIRLGFLMAVQTNHQIRLGFRMVVQIYHQIHLKVLMDVQINHQFRLGRTYSRRLKYSKIMLYNLFFFPFKKYHSTVILDRSELNY